VEFVFWTFLQDLSAAMIQPSKPLPKPSLLASLLCLIFLVSSCGNSARDQQVSEETEEETIAKIEEDLSYGLSTKGYDLVEGEVEPNQFLADILLPYGVSYGRIDEIAKDRDLFDVRRMRAGNPYAIFLNQADSASPGYFVYELDKTDYVVWDLQSDSSLSWKGQKPITQRSREIAGVIEGSLYQSLINEGAPVLLANRLAEIYAWSVDFYRIQAGDRFKASWVENYVEDDFVGIDTVKASLLEHGGREFWAFFHDSEPLGDYYDEKGESLRKAFLQAPVKFTRISSRYSGKRFHPVLKRYKSHLGTDYAAPHGTPIYSTGDGTVIAAAYTSGNGNYVKIRHNSVYTTQYLHMSKFASGMQKGKVVKQGDVIGYVGSTGLATGPHVCYRFWKNGAQVDPYKQDLPSADPIAEDQMEEYLGQISVLKDKLDAIPYPVSSPDAEELAEAVEASF
jgi:murein DD-endopeptidase MepM/ murein hydrolase activator NlpD